MSKTDTIDHFETLKTVLKNEFAELKKILSPPNFLQNTLSVTGTATSLFNAVIEATPKQNELYIIDGVSLINLTTNSPSPIYYCLTKQNYNNGNANNNDVIYSGSSLVFSSNIILQQGEFLGIIAGTGITSGDNYLFSMTYRIFNRNQYLGI